MPVTIGYNLELRCDHRTDDEQCPKMTVITRYDIDECVRAAKGYGWSIEGEIGKAIVKCPVHSGYWIAQEAI